MKIEVLKNCFMQENLSIFSEEKNSMKKYLVGDLILNVDKKYKKIFKKFPEHIKIFEEEKNE